MALQTARYISLLPGVVNYDVLKDAFFLARTGTTGATGTLTPYAEIKTTPEFSLKIGDGNSLCTLINYEHEGFQGNFLINCANHKPYVIFIPEGTDPVTLGGGKPKYCHHDHHHNCHHDHHPKECIPENHGLLVNPATDQNADFYIQIDYINDSDRGGSKICGILETSVFNVAIPLSI